VTQSSRRVSDNTRCRIDLSYPKGPFIVAKRQVGVKKDIAGADEGEMVGRRQDIVGDGVRDAMRCGAYADVRPVRDRWLPSD
jgi:hypothetical protein